MAEANISQLQGILESVSEQQLKTLQANLNCVRSRFYFSSILGPPMEGSEGKPDAFSTLLEGMSRWRHSRPEKVCRQSSSLEVASREPYKSPFFEGSSLSWSCLVFVSRLHRRAHS